MKSLNINTQDLDVNKIKLDDLSSYDSESSGNREYINTISTINTSRENISSLKKTMTKKVLFKDSNQENKNEIQTYINTKSRNNINLNNDKLINPGENSNLNQQKIRRYDNNCLHVTSIGSLDLLSMIIINSKNHQNGYKDRMMFDSNKTNLIKEVNSQDNHDVKNKNETFYDSECLNITPNCLIF